MTQTLDLNEMGFTEMQNEELEVVDGGFFGLDDLIIIGLVLLIGCAAPKKAQY